MNRIFIGIGNASEGDNGVGTWTAERLGPNLPNGMGAVQLNGEPADFVNSWQESQHATVIAAISSGLAPGTLLKVDLNLEGLPEQLNAYSAHPFGLSQCIALARKLGKVPAILDFVGIESGSIITGNHLSSKVKKSAERLVDELLEQCYSKTAERS